MTKVGWIVGPATATLALAGLDVVWVGLRASGGGLLLAAAVAVYCGAVASALVNPARWLRNSVIVAAYVAMLFATYLVAVQSRPAPPGTASGGASVPMPGTQTADARPEFAHLAEATTATNRGEPIEAAYRMFSLADFREACDASRPVGVARLESPTMDLHWRVGQPFALNRLSVVALDASGAVLPKMPVAIESQTGSSILDVRSDRIADGRVTPLRPGFIQLRIRTICDSGAGAESFLTASVSR